MSGFADKRFLIIAGQPKAGTTSLFDWLAQHPDVCGSSTKESRFFLDPDYPLPRSLGYAPGKLEDYAKNFERPEADVLLEASPDYLYCETPLKIAKLLPNAKIVVVLRDPVERITSAFHYFKQRGFLGKNQTIQDYVATMRDLEIRPDTPVHLRALDHCRPAYLERFQRTFGDRLLVLDFKTLQTNPADVYRTLCAHIDLAPSETVVLETKNQSKTSRSQFGSKAFYFSKGIAINSLRRVGLEKAIPLFRGVNKTAEAALFKKLETQPIDPEAVKWIRGIIEEKFSSAEVPDGTKDQSKNTISNEDR